MSYLTKCIMGPIIKFLELPAKQLDFYNIVCNARCVAINLFTILKVFLKKMCILNGIKLRG